MAMHRFHRRSTLFCLVAFAIILYNFGYFAGLEWGFSFGLRSPPALLDWSQEIMEEKYVGDLHHHHSVKFLFDNYEAPPPESMDDLRSRPVFLPLQSSTVQQARDVFR